MRGHIAKSFERGWAAELWGVEITAGTIRHFGVGGKRLVDQRRMAQPRLFAAPKGLHDTLLTSPICRVVPL